MIEPWRLTLAVALTVTVGVGVATAQTVIVRGAPPGSTIEVQLNAEGGGSATADADGDATLPVTLPAHVNETTVRIYVDLCGNLVRVLLVEQGLQPPSPAPACNRRETGRILIMRRVTTFVVDVVGSDASVHLRQGPAPAEWLRRGPPSASGWRLSSGTAPTGLVLFGGGGFASFSNVAPVACGDVTTCTAETLRSAVTAGAAYWFGRFVAAHVSYVRPADVTANGSGTNFQFNSRLHTDLVTVAGNVGAPIGAVRLYGQAGMNHHRALFSTTETMDDATVVIDTVTQTIKGGTQTLELKTAGWGVLFGGGVEIWATRSVAFYAEFERATLTGAALGGGEGRLDDHVTSILFGARVRIGR